MWLNMLAVIPLFHTGRKSPESPRIDFFSIIFFLVYMVGGSVMVTFIPKQG